MFERGLSYRVATACLFTAMSDPAFAQDADKKGMPQLDPSTYASQLFWLAVFFVLFYVFMRSVAMPRVDTILRTRETTISGDLDRGYHGVYGGRGLKGGVRGPAERSAG